MTEQSQLLFELNGMSTFSKSHCGMPSRKQLPTRRRSILAEIAVRLRNQSKELDHGPRKEHISEKMKLGVNELPSSKLSQPFTNLLKDCDSHVSSDYTDNSSSSSESDSEDGDVFQRLEFLAKRYIFSPAIGQVPNEVLARLTITWREVSSSPAWTKHMSKCRAFKTSDEISMELIQIFLRDVLHSLVSYEESHPCCLPPLASLPESEWNYNLQTLEATEIANECDIVLGCAQVQRVGSVVTNNSRVTILQLRTEDYQLHRYVLKQLRWHGKTSAPIGLLKKEVHVLKRLSGCEHILQLESLRSFTSTDGRGDFYQVFRYFDGASACRSKYHFEWNASLVSIFASKLLSALDFAHKRKIIHEDLKPNNVLFNPSTGSLLVIDWGNSIIHDEKNPSHSQLCALPYRPPEVACRLPHDFSVDLWAAGCMLAMIVFGLPSSPFGTNGVETDCELLVQITDILGTDSLNETFPPWMDLYCAPLRAARKVNQRDRQDWTSVYPCGEFATDNIRLINGLIQVNPTLRLTAQEALLIVPCAGRQSGPEIEEDAIDGR